MKPPHRNTISGPPLGCLNGEYERHASQQLTGRRVALRTSKELAPSALAGGPARSRGLAGPGASASTQPGNGA